MSGTSDPDDAPTADFDLGEGEEPDLFEPEILTLAEIGLHQGVLLPDELEALCRAVLHFAKRMGHGGPL